MRRKTLVIVAALAAAGACISPHARADEGTLPLRAGDTVTGTLNRCGEYHVLETALLRREIFRAKIYSSVAVPGAIQVRVFDPEGLEITYAAGTRQSGGILRMGPFEAGSSGLYRIELTTFTTHGTKYAAVTRVRRNGGKKLRLGKRRPAGRARVAPGATLRLRSIGAPPRLAITIPGEAPRELAPGDPMLQAMLAGGVSAPVAGIYRFEALPGSGKLRVRVRAPQRIAPRTFEFPALPVEADPSARLYWTGSWVNDTSRANAVHPDDPDPRTGPVATPGPAPSVWDGTLVTDTRPAPVSVSGLDDSTVWNGPFSGVGMPISGVPTLAEVVTMGTLEQAVNGPVYSFARDAGALGTVTIRVRFEVDGRPALAPLEWAGRTTMHWETESDRSFLDGRWTLAHDGTRGLQVLDGREIWVDDRFRTITSWANGFTLPSDGSWPSGDLSWAVNDPRAALQFTRKEHYDGGTSVEIDVLSGGVSPGTTRVDMTVGR